MKICRICKVPKPLEAFRVDRGYVRGECKECAAKARRDAHAKDPEKFCAASRKWSKENPEKRNAQKRRWYAKNRAHQKGVVRQRAYGISEDQYNQLMQDQKGKCSCCQTPLGTGRQIAVDHDHLTGKVRGVLCAPCNKGLGHFQDSFKRLIQAASYLRLHS